MLINNYRNFFKMLSTSPQEERKLTEMQRMWQPNRRFMPSSSVFDDIPEAEELFQTPQRNLCEPEVGKNACNQLFPDCSLNDVNSDSEFQDIPEELQTRSYFEPQEHILDASDLGDLPAKYVICPIKSHEMPVIGVYIDKRIVPGFKYKVRPLPSVNNPFASLPCLFEDTALTLTSIGRGYARRFTFEANPGCLNNNENYFWSDNRPEGFVFEIELISEGDKFTIFNAYQEAQGTLEVLQIEQSQIEISSNAMKEGVEKRAKIKFTGKVEFYETGVAKPMPLSGTVIGIKRKGKARAEIIKIINVNIRHQRYYLTPGIQTIHRRVTVRGQDIGDIPTKYTMTGLQPYEIPVVGTYVDPRIIPGFYYRVRPNDRKEHLFEGRTLKLNSIGMGYAKRLTFAPDSLVTPNNYLWSDNHPDGLGLEPRAVHTGMRFRIMADQQWLGEASVFRADASQMEERMEKVLLSSNKCAIVKYIHIDVMCHVHLAITGGSAADNEEHLMRVYGLAEVRKEPNSNEAFVVKVDNVGLDSQLNVLFAYTHTELTFYPL